MASINGKTACWKQMFLSICNKGALWWFWRTKTCNTLLYKLKCCACILHLYFNIVQHNGTNLNKTDADLWQWLYKNISSIYKKFFNYHKHSQRSTLLFSSNLLPSSGFIATDRDSTYDSLAYCVSMSTCTNVTQESVMNTHEDFCNTSICYCGCYCC